MNRTFQDERSDYEFGPSMGEFGEAEFNPEFETEGEVVRDHRRPAPSSAAWPVSRSQMYPQRAYPPRYVSRPSSYRPPAQTRYWPRPYAAQRPFSGAASRPYQWPWRPTATPGFYPSPQSWRPYLGYAQQQSAPRWRGWGWGGTGRWGRWPYAPSQYPYGDASYGGDAAGDTAPPPYMEPPPPPVIIAAPLPVPPPLAAEPPPPAAPMPDPATMATAPAQAQPATPGQPADSHEFFIEPEMFEFTPEFGEYEGEWGEREAGAYEYEGPPPQQQAERCPPYGPGEVAGSRTAAGHLPADVIQHPRGTLIADFGVDWRHTKPALERDPTLKAWLASLIAAMRADPSFQIVIWGFSDCVGNERDNAVLRRGRAQRVAQLLLRLAGPDARILGPRIINVDAATAGDYVATNATIQGRAQNRGVLIMRPETINIVDKAPGTP